MKTQRGGRANGGAGLLFGLVGLAACGDGATLGAGPTDAAVDAGAGGAGGAGGLGGEGGTGGPGGEGGAGGPGGAIGPGGTIGPGGAGGFGGSGGSGGAGGQADPGLVVEPVAIGQRGTLSSAPSPDGALLYFTTLGAEGGAVYRVPAAGGAPTLLSDDLVLPVDVLVSADGATLYIVDTGLEDAAGRGGAIRRLPSGGGAVETLATTFGYDPRALDLHVDPADGRSTLYFSGRDPETAHGGVYRIPLPGLGVERVLEHPDLVDPSGLAVTDGGDVYVADTVGAGDSGVFRVEGDSLSRLEVPHRLGYPAGLARTPDGTALLLSALTTAGHATLVRYDLTGELATDLSSESLNTLPEAGGLHRALAAPFYAFCGVAADATTTVFRLTVRP